MPEKLPFTVVFCSGADDGHPATDLEVGVATNKLQPKIRTEEEMRLLLLTGCVAGGG